MIITSAFADQLPASRRTFRIVGNALIQESFPLAGRKITLSTLGRLLRQKKSRRSIRVTHFGTYHYTVPVHVSRRDKSIAIGCVKFVGADAAALRMAALKASL